MRFIVGDSDRQDDYVAISILITLFSVVLVTVLSPILDLGAFGGLGEYKAWFILAYATSAFMNLCGEVARGIGEIKLIPICAGISSITTFILALVFIGQLKMGITGYFYFSICGSTSCSHNLYGCRWNRKSFSIWHETYENSCRARYMEYCAAHDYLCSSIDTQ